MKKRVISLLVLLAMALTICGSAASRDDEVYYDEKSYSFDEIKQLQNTDVIDQSDANYNKVSEFLDSIRDEDDAQIVKNGEFISKTFYIQVDENGMERKLTKKDMNLINEFKSYKASGYSLAATKSTSSGKSTYECSIFLTATPSGVG